MTDHAADEPLHRLDDAELERRRQALWAQIDEADAVADVVALQRELGAVLREQRRRRERAGDE